MGGSIVYPAAGAECAAQHLKDEVGPAFITDMARLSASSGSSSSETKCERIFT